MRSFLKYLLASILGFFVASIILFFISMGIISALVASAEKTVNVESNSILKLTLEQPIPERTDNNPLKSFDWINFKPSVSIGLNDIIKNIEKAAIDDRIKGIYLDLSYIPTGLASINEIRNSLVKFKESGKFIIAYGDYYMQPTYYLATAANKVYLNPKGALPLSGMRAEVMFYKKTLEALGIEPEIIRHGQFKSAVEPLILDEMSPANREQLNTLLSSIWSYMVNKISETRGIPVEQLNQFADQLSIKSAKIALSSKLVDGLMYKDQILDELKSLSGIDSTKEVKFVSLSDFNKVPAKREQKGLAKDKIAVIFASGSINMGEGDDEMIGSERISKAIRKARQDSSIKAIVLRVNSPGGSVLASDIIYREVVLAQKAKPVVASMSDLAASGGYYILANVDTIIASPLTITGSIGVFAVMVNIKKFMNEKLKISVDVAKTNKNADLLSIYRPMSEAEKEYLQYSVEEIYHDFVGIVAEGRKLTPERVDELGQGRVWSGINALDNGLINGFGGLQDAIRIAARMAKIDNYRVIDLPEQKNAFESLMNDFSAKIEAHYISGDMKEMLEHYKNVQDLISNGSIQARMAFDIDIK